MGIGLTAGEIWDELWKLIMGSSPIGEVFRAMIFYMAILFGAYIVGILNATAGTLLTLLLLLLSIGDFITTSEESFWNLWKRVPSTIGTVLMALLLRQPLDYLFGALFFIFLFLAAVQHIFRDAPTSRRRPKKKKR